MTSPTSIGFMAFTGEDEVFIAQDWQHFRVAIMSHSEMVPRFGDRRMRSRLERVSADQAITLYPLRPRSQCFDRG
ncbi:MAG: hypothetical protein H6720_22080 [Sandaracinus sp.]|nr:hypothetical protein [Sandaracinus sp.]